VGINEELLETFPIQKLIDKSDDQVCVIFTFLFNKFSKETLIKSVEVISKILEIEPSSVERKGGEPPLFMVQVFYDSHTMHWSDRASLKLEELQVALLPFDIRVSANVSINN